MLVTSASKAIGLAKFRCGEADIASKINGGRKPELCPTVGVADMSLDPTFLPREEVKTELNLTKDGG